MRRHNKKLNEFGPKKFHEQENQKKLLLLHNFVGFPFVDGKLGNFPFET